jgi:1-aminocyclopropane-1-carboxylate deaminase
LWLGGAEHYWLPREEWSSVSARVEAYLRQKEPGSAAVIPEGGDCEAALPGAMSLAWEIVVQEKLLGLRLDEVCLEAGSGLTAQALICGLGYLKRSLPVEVLLCAGTEESFQRGLELQVKRCQWLFGREPAMLPPFRCHKPPTAASYGSVNQRVWQGLKAFAASTGCLLDPIYGAKMYLWYEARSARPRQSLWIHGGGGLSLFGFPQAFQDKKTAGQARSFPRGKAQD